MNAEAGIALAALVASVGSTIVNWARANRADRHASRAETHAEEAHELARAAEERADRLERIQIERRDVSWLQHDRTDRDILSFVNVGADTAHDVELLVESIYDEFPRRVQRHGAVTPGDKIGTNFRTELEAKRDQFNATRATGSVTLPNLGVCVRIVWRSELHVPGIQEFERITL